MKIKIQSKERGIALMMVLIVVTVLTILAGKFAYQMKVETQLARNATFEADYEWAGRSGLERAKYFLAMSATGRGAQKDSLGAKWAGGAGDTNGPLADLSLKGYQLSDDVTIDLEIEDSDRKFNINVADEVLLKEALTKVVGVEEGTLAETIAQSILDWIDPDDKPRMAGAEASAYQNRTPPYFCKDGPMDDISELLMVEGVTDPIFNGSGGRASTVHQLNRGARQSRFEEVTYAVGMKDLFSARPRQFAQVNVNTAPAEVLRMFPGIDENIAQAIITARNGPDMIQGTDDDGFADPGAIASVAGMPPGAADQYRRFLTVRSSMFEVKVDVTAGGMKRRYVGLLQRTNPRDIQVVGMHWE